jgi:hypothetical protein
MEHLLGHLKKHKLKQVEVAVDYDDHENGSEGVIAAPYEQNPLELSPTLERVALDDGDLQLLAGPPGRLKALRVYGYSGDDDALFALLARPVCSGLESLHVENRGGRWGREPTGGPAITFSKLQSLRLSWQPLATFSNCQFPDLISLLGHPDLNEIVKRKWPKLQRLAISVRSDDLSALRAFARSDCCPDLTTLTILGYFDPAKVNFSFLAKCPHMPHLSLVRFPDYPMERAYIVDGGKLTPVRDDVMLDEPTPTTLYRLPVVF